MGGSPGYAWVHRSLVGRQNCLLHKKGDTWMKQSWSRRTWWVVVLAGVALMAVASAFSGAPQASAAATTFHYVRGWTVQGSWLCYGFGNGYYHCTQHWYRASNGRLISLNSPFVPSQGSVASAPSGSSGSSSGSSGGSSGGSAGCRAGGLPAVGGVANGMHWAPGGIPNDSCAAVQVAPYGGALSLWKTPPAPFNKVYYVNPSLYPGRGGWPTCSWWAREVSVSYGLGRGVAHSTPRVGAAIHYAPGVLGASSDGHYGHVVAVYTNGWVLSSEMNFYWRGGGAGRVIFRFIPVHTGGVSYIY